MAVSPLKRLVVVGFAEAEAAPEVVWSLVDAGARVTRSPREATPSPLRQSRHVTCHESRRRRRTQGARRARAGAGGDGKPKTCFFPRRHGAVAVRARRSSRGLDPGARGARRRWRWTRAGRSRGPARGFNVRKDRRSDGRDSRASATQLPVIFKPPVRRARRNRVAPAPGPGSVEGREELEHASAHWPRRADARSAVHRGYG